MAARVADLKVVPALALLVLFLVSRSLMGWYATHPESYGDVAGDIGTYEQRAEAMLDGGSPYAEVPLEYPPGALPLVLVPEALAPDRYSDAFVALALALDLSAFGALALLARRWGSKWGLWLWAGAPLLLGPIMYTRLDLLPAVMTVWAVERASAGSWMGSGMLLSYGAAAKLYPALFLPSLIRSAPRSERMKVLAGIAVVLIPLVAFGSDLVDVMRNVLGYHSARSIQIESTWGTGLLVAIRRGAETSIVFNFGAFHLEGGVAAAVKTAGGLISLVSLLAAIAALTRHPGDAPRFAEESFALVMLALACGLVFSPQFVVWALALAAVVLARRSEEAPLAPLLLVPIALATQWLFPFLYGELLSVGPRAVSVLAARNLLVIAAAVTALLPLVRRPG